MLRRLIVLVAIAFVLCGVNYCQEDYELGAQTSTPTPTPTTTPTPTPTPDDDDSDDDDDSGDDESEDDDGEDDDADLSLLEELALLDVSKSAAGLAKNNNASSTTLDGDEKTLDALAQQKHQNWLGSIAEREINQELALLSVGAVADLNSDGVLDCSVSGELVRIDLPELAMTDRDLDSYSDWLEVLLNSNLKDEHSVPEIYSALLCDSRISYQSIVQFLAVTPASIESASQLLTLVERNLGDGPAKNWWVELAP